MGYDFSEKNSGEPLSKGEFAMKKLLCLFLAVLMALLFLQWLLL